MSDQKAKEFADTLLKNATAEFFQADNPQCVYIRCRVKDKIQEIGASHLNDSAMNIAMPPSSALEAAIRIGSNWKALSDNKTWIQLPAYLRMDADRFYHWRSDIIFAKLYQQEPLQLPGGVMLPQSTQYIRVASFSAFWKSKVNGKAELTHSELETVSVGRLEAKIATDSLREQYGLPSKLDLLLQTLQRIETAPPTVGSTSQGGPSE